MNHQGTLAVVLGAARDGRHSETVMAAVVAAAHGRGWDVTEVDVRDHPQRQADRDPGDEVLRAVLETADAFVLVAPEYNHGYPGELRMLLDRRQAEFARKPVGIVAVSAGSVGGARVAQALLPVLNTIRAVVVQPTVQLSNVREHEDPFTEQRHEGLLDSMLAELEFYAAPLKEARARRSR